MHRESGLTLIEVLIAVVVLAVGLLGIAGLQSAALSNNLTSYQYTQALTLAQSMIERMRANRDGVLANAYRLDVGATPAEADANCLNSACSPEQQARWDIAMIAAQLSSSAPTTNLLPASDADGTSIPRGMLPGGRLSIVCDEGICAADRLRIVTVYWDAARSEPDEVNCTALRCIQLAYQP